MDKQEYNYKNLEGPDVNIEISLKEYGFAWIETETDILFYYGIKTTDDGAEYIKFDFCSIDKNINIKEEYNWVDFEAVNSFIGQDILDLPLTQQISDLVSYYGYENVFGSSYYGGLTLRQRAGTYYFVSLREK